MSPIDPRELSQTQTPSGQFDNGFRCIKCNYDLTGLPRATVCPECGTTNARPVLDRKRGTGASRAPVAYLRRLSRWLGACAAAFFVYLIFATIAGFYEHPVTLGLEFLAIGGWVASLWMVTKPKPDRFESTTVDAFDDPRWRWASVGTQACHLVVASAYILAIIPAFSSVKGLLDILMRVFDTIAFLGFVPVCVQFAALANWMGDDSAEKRCQTTAWLLAVGGVGLLVMPIMATILPVFTLLYVLLIFGILVGVIMLCVTLIGLAKAANWAVHNAKHKSVVSGRRAVVDQQRALKADAKLQERLNQIDKPQGQPRAGRSAPPKDAPVPKSHNITGSNGANPYEITDE